MVNVLKSSIEEAPKLKEFNRVHFYFSRNEMMVAFTVTLLLTAIQIVMTSALSLILGGTTTPYSSTGTLQGKAKGELCMDHLSECNIPLTCVDGKCDCNKTTEFDDQYVKLCSPTLFIDTSVELVNTIKPIVKGEQVTVMCRFTPIDTSIFKDSEIIWFFNGRKINMASRQIFNSTVYGNDQVLFSLLTIHGFRKSLTGTYTCKVQPKGQGIGITVGTVSITTDIFAEPEVHLEPPYLFVEKNAFVTVSCHAKHIDYIMYIGDSISSQLNEMSRSGDPFSIDTFSFIPQRTTYLRCLGLIARNGGNITVTSNKVVIEYLSKGDVTCPDSEDQQGINWKIAKGPSILYGNCPKGCSGHSTRECTMNGRWKETNFTNCLRRDMLEIMQEVEMLEAADPSEEAIEHITTKLSKAMPGAQLMLLSDVSQTIDILSNVSNIVSKDDSEKTLVSTTSLENIVGVTDQLLSTDQNKWENMNQPKETVNGTKQRNQMGAKLLMAVEGLAVASLKESKISSRPIIKSNIVVKRNQAQSKRDIYFPENSDAILKELNDWMEGSQNTIFLPSDALPVTAKMIRYSVLLFKGIRQTMSPQDKQLESKEVKSNVMAFSLNKKMKRLTHGLELTFGVPTVNFSAPVCGYLDISNSELGIWSTKGCKTQQLRSGLVKCICNHMTNFAVLMSPSRNLNSTHHQVLGIISICGCTISIISLMSLIIIYAILWRHMKKDRKTYLHLTLSICLLLVYVIFLAGIERSSHEPSCTITAVILHYILLVIFCLMLCEGVEILLAVLYVFPSSFPVWKLLLPACGIPVLIVGLTLAITQAEDYRSDKICWLNLSSGTQWAFVAPALAVILVNFVITFLTMRILLRSTAIKGKENTCKTKLALKSFAVLSPILGLTWLFGILSINSYTIIFQYLFAICNTLQGFAIFFFYCLSFYQVKDAFKVMKRIHKSRQSEAETSSSNKSRARDGLNIIKRKQKGSYNVENVAFLSTQAKSSIEETDQRELASSSRYALKPSETTSSQIIFSSDDYRASSADDEQESGFKGSDLRHYKDAELKI